MVEEGPNNAKSAKASASVAQAGTSNTSAAKEVDVLRDTPVRLLGYTNEVGEAFRSLIHVNLVRLSYAVASAYVLVDTTDKVVKADKLKCPDAREQQRKVLTTAVDTLVWQALASVIVPGITINRVCALSLFLLKRYSRLQLQTCKWTTTGVGLSCIPFIVSPIDHGVHVLMDRTIRQWLRIPRSDCD